MHADLFIAIHHDSVPDNLMQTWQYEGQQQQYNDDYPGYALFISNDNGDRAGSLLFGHFLGKELQARGLHYTPHYTLALMGHRRRELIDAEAGVYRYDQLIVLRMTRMPAVLLEAGSIVNRPGGVGIGQAPNAARSPAPRSPPRSRIFARRERFRRARGRRSRRRKWPRNRATPPQARPRGNVYAGAVRLLRNASVLTIMKLIRLTPSPVAKAGA